MRTIRQRIKDMVDQGASVEEATAIAHDEDGRDRRSAIKVLRDFEARGGTSLRALKRELGI